jgi:hypothetical protein
MSRKQPRQPPHVSTSPLVMLTNRQAHDLALWIQQRLVFLDHRGERIIRLH